MTENIQPPEAYGAGYLTVRVSTAGGAIPLENAAVNIRGGDIEASAVLHSLTTNSDGLTPTVSLPAPPRANSSSPQNGLPPYAVYNIDVFANGYSPAFFHNVPVFDGINSIQPAVLLPKIENAGHEMPININEQPTEGDKNE